MRAELVEIAKRPTMAELLDRLAARSVIDVHETAAEAIAAERADRLRR